MIEKSLSELSTDQEAEIVTIDGGWIMHARLKEMGIVVGQRLKKNSQIAAGGPVILQVNGAQVAVGAGMASRITVKIKSNARCE
jgi:ferrous iron transport protein A